MYLHKMARRESVEVTGSKCRWRPWYTYRVKAIMRNRVITKYLSTLVLFCSHNARLRAHILVLRARPTQYIDLRIYHSIWIYIY